MTSNKTLTVDLAVVGADEATEKFDRLTKAIERTAQVFTDLAEHPHGGFELRMVGNLVHIEVKPVAQVA